MILLFITSLHLGVEGGLSQPIIGFDYELHSGVMVKIFLGKEDLNHHVFLNLAINGAYYSGENPGYTFSNYGISFLIQKSNWRFAPFVETGVSYIARELNMNKEWGVVYDYAVGFLINFYYESIRIYPGLYYDGMTDFKAHAGNIGIKMGIDYEF